jgi:heme exporter protein D
LGAAAFFAVAAFLGFSAFSAMGGSSFGIWLPRGLLILRLLDGAVNGNPEEGRRICLSNEKRAEVGGETAAERMAPCWPDYSRASFTPTKRDLPHILAGFKVVGFVPLEGGAGG